MPVNRQTVRELSRTTLYNITSSGQAWRAFLDAAARLYKYSFPEQVLIYAQEPEATACAAKEVWYTRMKRSLRPDAQAIALPDPHSHFGRLKYVFDVRETQPLPGAPEFRQWSLPFEALERVTDRLGQEYGISREPVVADRVYALVMNAPRELYPMQLTAMLRAADAEGRWSGQDDAALARQFHQLVADSAAYMVGVRVGIGTGAVTSDALESITRFNSSGLAALAGTYASRLAASVLRDVERAARENDRLSVLRETPLTHQQLSVLTPQRRPLDFLYRLWLKTEYSHIDALRRAVRRETRRIYLKRQTEAFRKEHPMG